MSIGTILLIWFAISIITGPFIGRFAGFNRLDKD